MLKLISCNWLIDRQSNVCKKRTISVFNVIFKRTITFLNWIKVSVSEPTVSSASFSSVWCLCSWESPWRYTQPLGGFSQSCYLGNSSSVGLSDEGPVSSFQRRSSSVSVSSFYASLLEAVDCVMSCGTVLLKTYPLRIKQTVLPSGQKALYLFYAGHS